MNHPKGPDVYKDVKIDYRAQVSLYYYMSHVLS